MGGKVKGPALPVLFLLRLEHGQKRGLLNIRIAERSHSLLPSALCCFSSTADQGKLPVADFYVPN